MKKKIHLRLKCEDRRDQILNVATALFSRLGFQGTTTKEISQHAQVNEALIFKHFPTKNALYSALIERKFEEWKTQTLPLLEKTLNLPLKTALFKIAKLFVQKNRKNPHHFRIMLFSALENHHLSRFFFKQKPPSLVFLERFFEARIQKKQIRHSDCAILARFFIGVIFHYILMTDIFQAKRFYAPLSEDEVLRQHLQIFLEGIL